MNTRAQIPWRSTPHADKLARVRALTDEGLTASQIAEAFNRGLPEWLHITRNAIIGFWNRNGTKSKSGVKSGAGGFAPEVQAKIQANRQIRCAAAAAVRNIKKRQLGIRTGNAVARDTIAARKARAGNPPRLPVAPLPPAEVVHGAVPMLQVRSFQCRAVVEGRCPDGLAMMCGAETSSDTSSWCAHHARLYVVANIPKMSRVVRRFNA